MKEIDQQVEQLKKKFKFQSIYSTQPKELTKEEFQDISDRLRISRKDGVHTISKDICLTLKNGRVFITTNIAIHGEQ